MHLLVLPLKRAISIHDVKPIYTKFLAFTIGVKVGHDS